MTVLESFILPNGKELPTSAHDLIAPVPESLPSEVIVPLQINGNEVTTDITFDVWNPATEKLAWKCSSASTKDVLSAAEGARSAFPSWSKTKPSTRRDILLKAADRLAARAKELAEYMTVETAAPDFISDGDVVRAIDLLRDAAGRIATINGEIPSCGQDGKNAMIFKEPYGVVLGIAPWNAPYILGFRAAVYALAAGNTVILKGSELSPRCHSAIGQIFKEAGLPDGCLNVLLHRSADAPEITTALIEHPAVRKISFTGSTAVGRIIATTAALNLKPVLMELGGKASAIVLEDADIELAAQECALGALVHSGQICMSTERILVHSSIASSFTQAFKDAVSHVFPPDAPAPVLVNSTGVAKNERLIRQALAKNAHIVVGDVDGKEASSTRMRPIVVGNVNPEMDIYYQESFGPTASLITVESEDEAIKIANDTEYGLAAAVFTKNLASGLRVAKQIESAAVHINSMTVHDEPALPHGGIKSSGYGRFNATVGIEEFLTTKTVTWND